MIKLLVDHVDLKKEVYNQLDETLESPTEESTTVNIHSPVQCVAENLQLLELHRSLGQHEAATTIQSVYRGYKVRDQLREEEQAAAKIQWAFRMHRKRFWDQLESAVTKNQLGSRVGGSRLRLAMRHRETRRNENEAAKTIQAAYKEYRAKKDGSKRRVVSRTNSQ
jgi:predicted nucleic acid-binding protein